jgi:hypothetical protein
MSPCIIVALPEAVVRVILVVWIDIRHDARLDSAVCAKKFRVPYLATAYAPSGRYSFDDNTNCGHGLPWCLQRGLQLDGISFWNGDLVCDEDMYVTYMSRYGGELRWIEIMKSDGRGEIRFLSEVCKSFHALQRVALSASRIRWFCAEPSWDLALTVLVQSRN